MQLIVVTGTGVVIAGRVGSERGAVQIVQDQLLNHMSLADMQISFDRLVHADLSDAPAKITSMVPTPEISSMMPTARVAAVVPSTMVLDWLMMS